MMGGSLVIAMLAYSVSTEVARVLEVSREIAEREVLVHMPQGHEDVPKSKDEALAVMQKIEQETIRDLRAQGYLRRPSGVQG